MQMTNVMFVIIPVNDNIKERLKQRPIFSTDL